MLLAQRSRRSQTIPKSCPRASAPCQVNRCWRIITLRGRNRRLGQAPPSHRGDRGAKVGAGPSRGIYGVRTATPKPAPTIAISRSFLGKVSWWNYPAIYKKRAEGLANPPQSMAIECRWHFPGKDGFAASFFKSELPINKEVGNGVQGSWDKNVCSIPTMPGMFCGSWPLITFGQPGNGPKLEHGLLRAPSCFSSRQLACSQNP